MYLCTILWFFFFFWKNKRFSLTLEVIKPVIWCCICKCRPGRRSKSSIVKTQHDVRNVVERDSSNRWNDLEIELLFPLSVFDFLPWNGNCCVIMTIALLIMLLKENWNQWLALFCLVFLSLCCGKRPDCCWRAQRWAQWVKVVQPQACSDSAGNPTRLDGVWIKIAERAKNFAAKDATIQSFFPFFSYKKKEIIKRTKQKKNKLQLWTKL